MNKKRWPMLALLLMSLASCGGGGDDRDAARADLAAARQKWAAANVHDYQFTLRRECFCENNSTTGAGRFAITVQDDHVASASNRDTGVPYSQQDAQQLPTVDGLFDIIENAYDSDADSVIVGYDATRGFPVSIAIDPIRGAADDEVSYDVSEFQ